MLAQYGRRLSGPLLDRFDLAVDVPPPEADALLAPSHGESTAAVRQRLEAAAPANPDAPAIPDNRLVRRRLEKAISAFSLSPRAMHRAIAVARTIARLRGEQEAEADDLDEALYFRNGLSESV